MIIKTLQVVCDHVGCPRWVEGSTGESRALVVIKQARALGWVASDGRQYCPEHGDDAEGDLARWRAANDARAGSQDPTGLLGFADDPPPPPSRETARDIWDSITGKRPPYDQGRGE